MFCHCANDITGYSRHSHSIKSIVTKMDSTVKQHQLYWSCGHDKCALLHLQQYVAHFMDVSRKCIWQYICFIGLNQLCFIGPNPFYFMALIKMTMMKWMLILGSSFVNDTMNFVELFHININLIVYVMVAWNQLWLRPHINIWIIGPGTVKQTSVWFQHYQYQVSLAQQ